MKKVIALYKKLGQTPLELLSNFKTSNLEYSEAKMAYAGRLDPMAHGLMLYLVGDECKNRDDYQNMGKTYEVELILGFKTDTHDALGLIEDTNVDNLNNDYEKEIESLLKELIGEFEQEYPAFSSKTINGIPMYQLAKEGKLKYQKIPTKDVVTYSVELLDHTAIKADKLFDLIVSRIKKVNGDFRQEKIIDRWTKLTKDDNILLPVFKIRISASSGTYIRSIADQIGERLSTFAIAFDILRTDIGEYNIKQVENYEDCLGFDQGIFTYFLKQTEGR